MVSGICHNLTTNGVCITDGCPFNHDLILCNVCNIWCISQKDYDAHLNGKKHRGKLQGIDVSWVVRCNTCKINVRGGARGMARHENSSEHQQNIGASTGPDESTPCDICQRDVYEAWDVHLRSWEHRKKERYAAFKSALDEAQRDKYGVTISPDGEGGLDFGLIEADTLSVLPTVTSFLSVSLTTPGTILRLDEIRMSSAMTRNSRAERCFRANGPSLVAYGTESRVTVTFDPAGNRGRFRDRIELVFFHEMLGQRFVITRDLCAVVGVQADQDLLKPIAPYQPRRKTIRVPEVDVVPGVAPPALATIEWKVQLQSYDVPKRLRNALENGRTEEKVRAVHNSFLPPTLNVQTYGRYWKTVLHVEELQSDEDLERYDMFDVPLIPQRKYYILAVPGLAEKRPSVIVSDRIHVKNSGSTRPHWFEGRVHAVRQSEVVLQFDPSFNSYKGQKYDVRFKLNRLPFRRMHQALDTVFAPERVMFPTRDHIRGVVEPRQRDLDQLRTINKHIMTNPPQHLAVASILQQREGSVPFIVFGPPGTGKTVTIVEAIRQLLLKDRNIRIFACAPSNSAADLIAIRLKDIGTSQLFRLNAVTRSKENIPADLLPFCKQTSDGTFCVPPLEKLKTFRVIVSTCISASIPHGIGIPAGHFTHIFMDEAGQAHEPEAMIAIKTLADHRTNIILSGDPKQLGPIIRSEVAMKLLLGQSYLERLMNRDIYDEKEGRGISVVKLVQNWRSHPRILQFPNEKFYRGELEACADRVLTHSLLRSEVVRGTDFPLVFHAITGKDMREAQSPSFFNPDEASLVKDYVRRLRSDQRLRLTDDHIGVISPYHAQCGKIRTLLKATAPRVKVGSVEEFQGQERRVIIISTVRSDPELVEFDMRHTLGFVANPRRFNVAVTRAQALLIVIGDPNVLSLDPLWRSFLNYIYSGGGWTGRPIAWDPEDEVDESPAERRARVDIEINDLIERTKSMIIRENGRSGLEDDHDAANVERPWRETE